tara:strand:+ start:188 stop:649 length:462 start_codon:yes stop_codon:yes gene_type:complete
MNELDLLKEIEDLNKQIKTGELEARDLKDSDWDTLVSWWRWWRWPVVQKDFLPENGTGGIMVEKDGIPIVAGFLYCTNSATVILEWIVSNPKYKDKDRKQAIEMLIKEAEKVSKETGYKYMFSIGRNKHLIETHKKLDWFVDDNPSYEITKTI